MTLAVGVLQACIAPTDTLSGRKVPDMFGKTLSRKWAIEMKYAPEGLCLQRSYRREVETGILFRICLFDGTTVGKELADGTFDDVFPLFRDMIRIARSVGPWAFEN